MKRARLIDKTSGKLRKCVLPEIYRYCHGCDIGNHGYKRISYAGLAHAVGLPWLFADDDNARTIVVLRDALSRLARTGLLRIKTDTHTTVYVMIDGKRETQ